jgi:hypothetical protein
MVMLWSMHYGTDFGECLPVVMICCYYIYIYIYIYIYPKCLPKAATCTEHAGTEHLQQGFGLEF